MGLSWGLVWGVSGRDRGDAKTCFSVGHSTPWQMSLKYVHYFKDQGGIRACMSCEIETSKGSRSVGARVSHAGTAGTS